MNNNKNISKPKAGEIQTYIILGIFIMGIFSFVGLHFVQKHKKKSYIANKFSSPESFNKARCIRNMNILLGACEMYNMDHNLTMHKLKESDYTSKHGRLRKYLKSGLFVATKKCQYYSIGDLATTKGTIASKNTGN